MNQTNKIQPKTKMNIHHSWNYFLKRIFSKKSTWITLFFHLFIVVLLFFIVRKEGWFLGMQREIVEGPVGGHNMLISPKINNTNDFFACIFPNLVICPIVIWTYFLSPIAWFFWWQFDDIGQATQTDGTDLFFLSTEIPTSRKQIFRGKVTFLTSFLVGLYLILFALPLSLLLWKANYFGNFTGLHTFLFLTCNFLIFPFFFFAPLVILLFALASLNSVWYTFLKWFGRLSLIFLALVGFLVFQALYYGGGIGEKILEWGKDFFQWLSQNYLLTTSTIMGVVIFLALFTLSLAYRDFQKKDLH